MRLNRFFTLLHTESTQFTVACQIGDIGKWHWQELNPLLQKVSQDMRSRNWDTRVTSAKVIGSIADYSKREMIEHLVGIAVKKFFEAGLWWL